MKKNSASYMKVARWRKKNKNKRGCSGISLIASWGMFREILHLPTWICKIPASRVVFRGIYFSAWKVSETWGRFTVDFLSSTIYISRLKKQLRSDVLRSNVLQSDVLQSVLQSDVLWSETFSQRLEVNLGVREGPIEGPSETPQTIVALIVTSGQRM